METIGYRHQHVSWSVCLLVVYCNKHKLKKKTKTKGDIGHHRLRLATYNSRNSLLWVAARKGFNTLPINIFTVTLGFEIAPVITRQPGALRLPHYKKSLHQNENRMFLLLKRLYFPFNASFVSYVRFQMSSIFVGNSFLSFYENRSSRNTLHLRGENRCVTTESMTPRKTGTQH